MSELLITQFTSHLEANRKAYSTIIAYRKDLAQLLELAGKDLAKLTTEDIRQVLASMGNNFAPKTVSRKINSYRTFYKFLQQTGRVTNNPAENVQHPKFTPNKPRILSPMEFLALREVSRSNSRLFAMIELTLQTGIRIGELSRLKIGDVSFADDKGTLYIREYSTNPARTIPLNPRASKLLKEYLQKLNSHNPDDALFSTRDGKHIIVRNIRSSIDRAMAKAEIEKASVNDLRNTFIVSQLKAGVPTDYLAVIAGHSSRATTNKYLELLPSKYHSNGEQKLVEI